MVSEKQTDNSYELLLQVKDLFHAFTLGITSMFVKTHRGSAYLFIYMTSVEFGLVNVIQVSALTSLITWQSKTKNTECIVLKRGFRNFFRGLGVPGILLVFLEWGFRGQFS